ncbi:MobQ family relaxase [uncultured Jannaschia sp.]|uniref:MobQ family relaxase n=1 Tax=uncultured Jannaschia sp. TaxID=293347 RepID=UPI0026023387|nr:MobQ family relaxase [uncultured Jannaschia sp.]
MAIYHLSAKVIGRKTGRSAVAAAAYRSAGRMRDERQGIEHDYRRKGGVVHAEILAPDNAPEWMRDRDRLWNAVEAVERRKDAQLAREIEVALPRELSREARRELVRGFVEREFVGRGMIADLAIHEGRARDGREQPHAHVMLTLRELTGEGFGKKERGWNAPERLQGWRESWAREANQALERAGRSERIDHRTLEAQREEARGRADRERGAGRPELALVYDRDAVSFDREPEPKIGPAATALERRGIETERGTAFRAAAERNVERRDRGWRQLELRLELMERGRAFVAAARERLDGLWSRAECAMERIRGRREVERSGEDERERDLRARRDSILGRTGPERDVDLDREAADPECERARRDAILGRTRPGREQPEPEVERFRKDAGEGKERDRDRRDAILGRKKDMRERSPGRDRDRER